MQLTMKPVGKGWNKQAKKAAGMIAKGTYTSWYSGNFLFHMFSVFLTPISWFVDLFIRNDSSGSNAPGASSGDSYKIFNQAETEA